MFQIPNKNILAIYVNIKTLKYMPAASWTMYMTNIWVIHFYQYIWGKFNEIILQRYDIFILFAKTFDPKPVLTAYVGCWQSPKIP